MYFEGSFGGSLTIFHLNGERMHSDLALWSDEYIMDGEAVEGSFVRYFLEESLYGEHGLEYIDVVTLLEALIALEFAVNGPGNRPIVVLGVDLEGNLLYAHFCFWLGESLLLRRRIPSKATMCW